jgi:hypothetical protein
VGASWRDRRVVAGVVIPGVALATLAILLGAGSGSGASAARAASPAASGKVARATLQASGGYKISLLATIAGRESPIGVIVEGHEQEVEYMARGLATARRLEASLGPFGKLDMSFHPKGRVLQSPKSLVEGCPTGRRSQPGMFTGTFRFRGQGGFTVAHAVKFHGTVGAPTAPTDAHEEKAQLVECFTREPLWKASKSEFLDTHDATTSPTLIAESVTPERTIVLGATPLEFSGGPPDKTPKSLTVVGVLVREETGGVTVTHALVGGGPAKRILAVKAGGSEATLTPGPPFTGSATYIRTPPEGTAAWSGDLGIGLSGLGKVALTGPGFSAALEG